MEMKIKEILAKLEEEHNRAYKSLNKILNLHGGSTYERYLKQAGYAAGLYGAIKIIEEMIGNRNGD